MEKDYLVINKQLMDRQKEWFVDIVEPWVEENRNKPSERKKRYFKRNYGSDSFEFAEPFFTSINECQKENLLIMFVGQETNGWGDYQEFISGGMNIAESQRYVREFIKNSIEKRDPQLKYEKKIPLYDAHAFWNFIRSVYDSVNKRINVIWTELDKIHYKCKDYKGEDVKCITLWEKDEERLNKTFGNEQKTMLEYEIEILKPDLIVFLTGPSYAKSMKSALHNNDLKKPKLDVVVQEFSVLNTICLWTYHPNYLNRANLWDRVVDSIVDKVRSL